MPGSVLNPFGPSIVRSLSSKASRSETMSPDNMRRGGGQINLMFKLAHGCRGAMEVLK